MASINSKQLRAFETAYSNYKKLFIMEIDDWWEAQLITLKSHDLVNTQLNFTHFGIQSFLHNIKKVHDECLLMLKNVEMAQDIANGLHDPEDDLEGCY